MGIKKYYGIKECIVFLILISLSSCVKDNESNNVSSRSYKKEVKKFLGFYNELLMTKVNESFWSDFDFYKKNRFKTEIIISSTKQTLIYLAKSDKEKDVTNTFFTNKNPVLFIQELKNNIYITPIKYKSFFYIRKGLHSTISNFTFEGTPIPVSIEDNCFVVLYNYGISIKRPLSDQFVTTYFPGISFYIGSNMIKDFGESFKKAADDIFNSQLQRYYVESELFRKALMNPIFKTIASEINQRRSEAQNKKREYPAWEFDRDINKMREHARKNGLTENYVDEIIKDPQYKPVSGTLLFYYSNERAFMIQWILINIFFLILIYISKTFLKRVSGIIKKSFTGIILAANGWVFYERPTLISIEYWIAPFIVIVIAFILLYYKEIKKAIK